MSSQRPVTILCVLVLVLAGCRSYGGYGSEEATLEEIRQANLAFAEALEEAERRAELIAAAAATNPGLELLAAQWTALVHAHEVVLAEHQLIAEEVAETDDYRKLNRALGDIAITQATVLSHYDRLLEAALTATDPDFVQQRTRLYQGAYHVVPPYYARAQPADAGLTLEEVLPRLAALPPAALRGLLETVLPIVPEEEEEAPVEGAPAH